MLLEELLKPLIAEKHRLGVPKAVIINVVKEYIQHIVLHLLYTHPEYKKLVFKGGSCLRICYGLPRLSEDLDFDCPKTLRSKGLLTSMETYLSREIRKKYYPDMETKIQSDSRLYCKFPLLYRLGLSKPPESNKLYVKIEITRGTLPGAQFDLTPVSVFGYNFIAYHYDLPTLMAGKIDALIHRLWWKGKKDEIDIKGRDFYDLYWFLERGVRPNWRTLKKIIPVKNKEELHSLLLQRITRAVTPAKLAYDLKNFLPDPVFVIDFSKQYKKIMRKFLSNLDGP